MQNDKLLPCPFCGGTADFLGETTSIKCRSCGGAFIATHPLITHMKVAEAWNTRKALKEIIEQLKKELKRADEEKQRCVNENSMQFDTAKGYATGISNALDIVKKDGVDNAE